MSSEKLNLAISAIKSGDNATGARLLNELLKDEPMNESAWLWLATCVDDVGMKIACLKKALFINPKNQIVIKALSKLEQPPQPTLEEIIPKSAKEIPYSSSDRQNHKEEKSGTGFIQGSEKSLREVYASPSSSVKLKKSIEIGKGKSKPLVILGIGAGFVFFACLACGIIGLISQASPSTKATGTAKAIAQASDISIPIELTYTPTKLQSPTKVSTISNNQPSLTIPSTLSPTQTVTPIPVNVKAFLDCLSCAQQPGWRINLRSDPGRYAGTIVDYLRHGDYVTINKSIWDEDEKIWWYLVEGFNSYEMYGRTVSGWISGEILTVNPPQPYPLGIAWTDFYAGDDIGMGINIWSEPGYLNTGGGGHVVGELIIGNQIEMIDRQWDEGSELWFYRVDGDDKNTRENVSGWLDGVFIVLTQP